MPALPSRPTVDVEYEPGTAGRRDRVFKALHFPDGCSVSDLREAVPGTDGDVRVSWKAPSDADWHEAPWQAVDPHAGGWTQSDYRPDIHRFLRVAGGFLSVTVERPDSVPTMTLRFHDVDGAVKFEDAVTAR